MYLERELRNAITEAIRGAGFDPRDFDLQHARNDAPAHVVHPGTGSALAITPGTIGVHHVRWAVEDGPSNSYDADELGSPIAEWLRELERISGMRDLWAEAQQAPEIAALATSGENTPFTSGEQDEIVKLLTGFIATAQERWSLSDEQMRVLTSEVRYTQALVGHLRRIDWLKVTAETFAGIVATKVLTSGVAQEMLQVVAAGVAHMFGHVAPQLPGPVG